MREIVFDTETTGTRPDLGHRIIELGAIEIIDGKIGEGKQWYFNPEREVEIGAYEVHGLSNEFLADKPLFSSCLVEILVFFADASLVAHNADFDRNFLNHELRRADYPPLPGHRFIDTLRLSRQRFKSGRHTLDALCARFGINTSHRALHGALKDSELLAQAYLRLTKGEQHSMHLPPEATSDTTQTTKVKKAVTAVFHDRQIPARKLNNEAIAAHRTFIADNVKNPIWLQNDQPDNML